MKASKQFVVKRDQAYGDAINWVFVAQSRKKLEDNPGGLCLKQFRTVFGFTPRKGKPYKVTISDFQVEEISA